ncbi:unnamed protein product [Amoebophrya sp. A25]|nr:unnamed protein product [Amoebophrya sp. A25]|eukprot:GSA25T00004957001.1
MSVREDNIGAQSITSGLNDSGLPAQKLFLEDNESADGGDRHTLGLDKPTSLGLDKCMATADVGVGRKDGKAGGSPTSTSAVAGIMARGGEVAEREREPAEVRDRSRSSRRAVNPGRPQPRERPPNVTARTGLITTRQKTHTPTFGQPGSSTLLPPSNSTSTNHATSSRAAPNSAGSGGASNTGPTTSTSGAGATILGNAGSTTGAPQPRAGTSSSVAATAPGEVATSSSAIATSRVGRDPTARGRVRPGGVVVGTSAASSSTARFPSAGPPSGGAASAPQPGSNNAHPSVGGAGFKIRFPTISQLAGGGSSGGNNEQQQHAQSTTTTGGAPGTTGTTGGLKRGRAPASATRTGPNSNIVTSSSFIKNTSSAGPVSSLINTFSGGTKNKKGVGGKPTTNKAVDTSTSSEHPHSFLKQNTSAGRISSNPETPRNNTAPPPSLGLLFEEDSQQEKRLKKNPPEAGPVGETNKAEASASSTGTSVKVNATSSTVAGGADLNTTGKNSTKTRAGLSASASLHEEVDALLKDAEKSASGSAGGPPTSGNSHWMSRKPQEIQHGMKKGTTSTSSTGISSSIGFGKSSNIKDTSFENKKHLQAGGGTITGTRGARERSQSADAAGGRKQVLFAGVPSSSQLSAILEEKSCKSEEQSSAVVGKNNKTGTAGAGGGAGISSTSGGNNDSGNNASGPLAGTSENSSSAAHPHQNYPSNSSISRMLKEKDQVYPPHTTSSSSTFGLTSGAAGLQIRNSSSSADNESLLSHGTDDGSAPVRVVCRIRPMNEKERKLNPNPIVTARVDAKKVLICRGTGGRATRQEFPFDEVFGPSSTQDDIFETVLEPRLNDVLCGFETTIVAYGQTGTGKTYTMEGELNDEGGRGLIPRAVKVLFERLSNREKYFESYVTCSYLEIYNEELTDLMAPHDSNTQLSILDNGSGSSVCRGLSEHPVDNVQQTLELMKQAQERRRVGETQMNKASSRSHCLFTVSVMCKTQVSMRDGCLESKGKLHLVDLAGSESAGSDTTSGNLVSTRSALNLERKNINQSLLVLGRVIQYVRDLSQGGPPMRIPYRDSKLTRLLQEAIGGRCKTCVIATLSPSQMCVDESMSTLNYAATCAAIKNRPKQECKLRAGIGFSGQGLHPDHSIMHHSVTDSMLLAGSKNIQDWTDLEMKVHQLQCKLDQAETTLARKVQKEQGLVVRIEALSADVERFRAESQGHETRALELEQREKTLQHEVEDLRDDARRSAGTHRRCEEHLRDQIRAHERLKHLAQRCATTLQKALDSRSEMHRRLQTVTTAATAQQGELVNLQQRVESAVSRGHAAIGNMLAKVEDYASNAHRGLSTSWISEEKPRLEAMLAATSAALRESAAVLPTSEQVAETSTKLASLVKSVERGSTESREQLEGVAAALKEMFESFLVERNDRAGEAIEKLLGAEREARAEIAATLEQQLQKHLAEARFQYEKQSEELATKLRATCVADSQTVDTWRNVVESAKQNAAQVEKTWSEIDVATAAREMATRLEEYGSSSSTTTSTVQDLLQKQDQDRLPEFVALRSRVLGQFAGDCEKFSKGVSADAEQLRKLHAQFGQDFGKIVQTGRDAKLDASSGNSSSSSSSTTTGNAIANKTVEPLEELIDPRGKAELEILLGNKADAAPCDSDLRALDGAAGFESPSGKGWEQARRGGVAGAGGGAKSRKAQGRTPSARTPLAGRTPKMNGITPRHLLPSMQLISASQP